MESAELSTETMESRMLGEMKQVKTKPELVKAIQSQEFKEILVLNNVNSTNIQQAKIRTFVANKSGEVSVILVRTK